MRWPHAAVTLLALPVCGCGRVGYELLPAADRSPPVEAGVAGADGATPFSSAGGTAGRSSGGGAGTGGAPNGGAGGSPGGAAGTAGSGGSHDAGADGTVPACPLSPQPVADYCVSLPQLPAPASIDGELDCGLALNPLTAVGWTGGALPPDASAEYAVAWRLDGLYFYVRVHDPLVVPAPVTRDIWEGDGIELFVDSDGVYAAPPAYDSPGTRQFTTSAAGMASVARGQIWAYPLPRGGALPAAWLSTTFRSFPKPDGYVLEAFVVAADLGLATWALSAGARVGVDVGVDVSYPDADASGAYGHRLGQYFMSVDLAPPDGGVASPFVNTEAFCNPTLVGR
jgi:hypothetical protein